MITRATMTALAVLLLGPPGTAAPAAARPAPAAASQEGGPPAPLPAIVLPINLERVKRQLEARPGSEEARFKLEFYVNVYARAPRFDPLEGFDIHTGLVPHGAPSHAEMMRQWTPAGFDVPIADLGSVLGWILGR